MKCEYSTGIGPIDGGFGADEVEVIDCSPPVDFDHDKHTHWIEVRDEAGGIEKLPQPRDPGADIIDLGSFTVAACK